MQGHAAGRGEVRSRLNTKSTESALVPPYTVFLDAIR